MRIKNVEKFRDELYKAIKDNYITECSTSSAMWKDGNEFSNDMSELDGWAWNEEEQRPMVVSLAHPISFATSKIAITIDEDGANFYDTSDTNEYKVIGYVMADLCRNKMSFVMAVAKKIENLCNR